MTEINYKDVFLIILYAIAPKMALIVALNFYNLKNYCRK